MAVQRCGRDFEMGTHVSPRASFAQETLKSKLLLGSRNNMRFSQVATYLWKIFDIFFNTFDFVHILQFHRRHGQGLQKEFLGKAKSPFRRECGTSARRFVENMGAHFWNLFPPNLLNLSALFLETEERFMNSTSGKKIFGIGLKLNFWRNFENRRNLFKSSDLVIFPFF